ncbi:TetR family transcriptional regulator [Roseomonas sp. PWR1]|uniref:TetR family transcriptional regulator n=1 Tax=Roseomonas nitratireducens TaxID=2820810 RepID=A0ABS4APT5_9PROT|nr:TetR family transcriptional regulator [Neoroseomonas nitratireducens]MBP0463382.1 TetR family transcriptional regulator [Neoroseomonas nitratireducens]
MGRRKTIDRDRVLDVAEEIVATRGAAALTIGAVAAAAGITKGGVQSCFGTKEAMIAAMLKRWLAEDDRRFRAAGGDAAAPADRIRAHVETTHSLDEASHARAVALLAALLQTPEHLMAARGWYAGRLGSLDPRDAGGRRARLAFLAAEGATLLRFCGLLSMTQHEWDDIFADIRHLLEPSLAARPPQGKVAQR